MIITKDNFLSELKKQNPLSIEFIVREYCSLIRSVIGKYLYNNESTLDECFNDVLLVIWNNSDKFDDKKSNFRSWLCAITKYRAIDTLRREMKHKERYVSMESDDGIDWLNTFHASENGIEITDNSIEELRKLLSCLSESDKDLFFRRHVDEQAIDEIAKDKNMNRNQVYTRISRGKDRIKNHVEFQPGGSKNE